MRSADIRTTFLEFFRERDHRVWPSSSLIPNDPTLLLTVAGMVPFKPYFLGEAAPDHPRAVSVQKVARTLDIENVGETVRHLTFFEMLGNFSFGDYFKREAIRWAWELSVAPPPRGFGFEPDRIWVTVYEEDDEAERLWTSETDVPAARVVRRGPKDNFWSTGGPGPCGPCSELYYDRGPEFGPEGGPEVDESRFLEYWNLVFMQFEREGGGDAARAGSDVIVGPLPRPSVDTGMGLERMAMLLQHVPNVYETDVLRPMLDQAVDLTGVRYGDDERTDVFLRVIAEHARSSAFLVADGVLPSNEARGYVLRRLLRRAVRSARKLGTDRPVMPTMVGTVIDVLGEAWPELRQQAQLIARVATSEEDAFARTLRSGTAMLDTAVAEAKAAGRTDLDGQTAFTLHDTYGFPVDLTLEIAREHGLELDRDAFAAAMDEQRARARAAVRAGRDVAATDAYREAASRTGAVRFVGYSRSDATAPVTALVHGGVLVDRVEEGDEVQVVLATTPFYAEGGGQLGDHGLIETPAGRVEVSDTQQPLEGLIVHAGRVVAGEVGTGEEAHAAIDVRRRASIRRGHTATHILHATLKDVLGDHAAQAGSAIDAGRFRFDFPHFEPVHAEQLADLESRVNTRIAADPEVRTIETSQEEARRMGAMALFGEKYGDRVRVVEIGDFSRELCGGTHVHHTGEVGLFTVLSEGSIAANLRRIEAVTGPEAFTYLSKERMVAEQVARLLKVPTVEAAGRVAELLERLRATEKALQQARTDAVLGQASALLGGAERIDGTAVVAGVVTGADRDGLRTLALDLRNRAGRAVVVLGAPTADGKAQLVCAVDPSLGLAARDVLQPGAQVVGGGAGGKGDVAAAGGRDGTKVAEAVEASRRAARDLLTAAPR